MKKSMTPKDRAYYAWLDMTKSCDDPNHPKYPENGGKGISYDPRWKDFNVFYQDMGDPPENWEH